MMDETERTAKRQAQTDFARENRFALFFLNVGAADYAAARLCLIHGEASGFPLGTQAIEKTMKGILILLNKTFDPRGASHSLKGLNQTLKDQSSAAALATDDAIDRFAKHYNDRYPREDGKPHVEASSTGEVADLDEIMLHLVLNEPEVPTRYRCGVGARLHGLATTGESGLGDRWILEQNTAFQKELSRLLPKIKDAFLPAPEA